MSMMTELCQNLRNWFDRDQKKWHGKITISNNAITSFEYDTLQSNAAEPLSLIENQYFRIIGSLFNDGVHKYLDPEDQLVDESFSGYIWAMAVPPAVIALCDDIEEWQAKYGGIDSALMSPFASESFGGYSYSKGSRSGANSSGLASVTSWEQMFASRLNAWRKIL